MMYCLLCLMFVMGMAGCGTTNPTQEKVTPNTLILYLSCSGNTQKVADYTGFDMIRLEAEGPYPDDYQETVNRADTEHAENAHLAMRTALFWLDSLSEFANPSRAV